MLTKVTQLEKLGGFRLRVRFSDGSEGVHDFTAMVSEPGPMLEPLRDEGYFSRVFLEFGAPTWPNGFDIAGMAAPGDGRRRRADAGRSRIAQALLSEVIGDARRRVIRETCVGRTAETGVVAWTSERSNEDCAPECQAADLRCQLDDIEPCGHVRRCSWPFGIARRAAAATACTLPL